MIRIKNGILKKLSNLSGFQVSYLCDVAARRRRPILENAKKLEKFTGISWTIWLDGSREQIVKALNKEEIQ